MIKHVAFFVYPVRDLAKARHFYEHVLGLKLESEQEGHWLEFNIQGTVLAITDWLAEATPCHTAASIALEVADAEGLLSHLQAQQVRIIKPLFDTPICRMAVIADPDGNGIIIHQGKSGQ